MNFKTKFPELNENQVKQIEREVKKYLDDLQKTLDYNKHDLGEFGEVVRLRYINNFITDTKTKLGDYFNG